jgi:hypothetical protein
MSDKKLKALKSGVFVALAAGGVILCWRFYPGIWIPVLVIFVGSALIVGVVALVDAVQRRHADSSRYRSSIAPQPMGGNVPFSGPKRYGRKRRTPVTRPGQPSPARPAR